MKRDALAVSVLALALGCALVGPVRAEEAATAPPQAKPASAQPESRSAPQLVRLQIVLVRQQGEKKTASIPYTLVASTSGRKGQLRMGVEVPIAVSSGNSTSFQYKNVGTNIDCIAREAAGGQYEIELQVENSSIYRGPEEGAAARQTAIVGDKPMFRSFAVQLSLVMRDGQSLQSVASTDPVTGEEVKIDVTLKVVK